MKTPLLFAFALLPSLALADGTPTTTSPSTPHSTSTSPTSPHPATTHSATTSPATTSSTTTDANHPNIPDPTEELKVMTERLSLSPNQQAAIKPILIAEFDQRKAIEDNKSLTVQQQHDQEGTVHRASLQKIKAIFTPAQMALIEEGMKNPSPSPTHLAPASSK